MGLNFLDPKEPYDASKYDGITFFAKRAASSTGKLVVKMPDGKWQCVLSQGSDLKK